MTISFSMHYFTITIQSTGMVTTGIAPAAASSGVIVGAVGGVLALVAIAGIITVLLAVIVRQKIRKGGKHGGRKWRKGILVKNGILKVCVNSEIVHIKRLSYKLANTTHGYTLVN